MRSHRVFALFVLLFTAACEQTTLVDIDDGNGGGGGGNGGGGGGTPASCPTSIDYTPRGMTIARNQNVTASLVLQSTWPTNCQVVWGTPNSSILLARGAESTYQIEGAWYYAGKTATITGVYTGSTTVFARVIRLGADGKWTFTGVERSYTWTVN
jgi:hypothetical protein